MNASAMSNVPKLKGFLVEYLRKIGAEPADTIDGIVTAKCPLHDDEHPSLEAKVKDGSWVWYCHPCQKGGTIVELHRARRGFSTSKPGIAQTITELEALFGLASPNGGKKEEKPAPWTRSIATSYDHTDEAGRMIFQVVRFADAEKDFSQRQPGGPYGWRWNLKGIRTVLYNLPVIVKAGCTTPIFLVEGEKDADTLNAAGHTATTVPMGAGKWRSHYAETLAGKWVVLFGDNDTAGREHVTEIAGALAGRVERLSKVDITKLWPQCPAKGDVSAWTAAGGDLSSIPRFIEDWTPVSLSPTAPTADASHPPQYQNFFLLPTDSMQITESAKRIFSVIAPTHTLFCRGRVVVESAVESDSSKDPKPAQPVEAKSVEDC